MEWEGVEEEGEDIDLGPSGTTPNVPRMNTRPSEFDDFDNFEASGGGDPFDVNWEQGEEENQGFDWTNDFDEQSVVEKSKEGNESAPVSNEQLNVDGSVEVEAAEKDDDTNQHHDEKKSFVDDWQDSISADSSRTESRQDSFDSSKDWTATDISLANQGDNRSGHDFDRVDSSVPAAAQDANYHIDKKEIVSSDIASGNLGETKTSAVETDRDENDILNWNKNVSSATHAEVESHNDAAIDPGLGGEGDDGDEQTKTDSVDSLAVFAFDIDRRGDSITQEEGGEHDLPRFSNTPIKMMSEKETEDGAGVFVQHDGVEKVGEWIDSRGARGAVAHNSSDFTETVNELAAEVGQAEWNAFGDDEPDEISAITPGLSSATHTTSHPGTSDHPSPGFPDEFSTPAHVSDVGDWDAADLNTPAPTYSASTHTHNPQAHDTVTPLYPNPDAEESPSRESPQQTVASTPGRREFQDREEEDIREVTTEGLSVEPALDGSNPHPLHTAASISLSASLPEELSSQYRNAPYEDDVKEYVVDWRTRAFPFMTPERYGTITLIGLLFLFSINGAIRSLAPAAFKALFAEFDLSASQLGMIPFLRNFVAAAALPMGGYLSDKLSRRWIMVVTQLFMGVMTMLLALTHSYSSFLLIRTMSGLGFDIIIPIAASYSGDYFRRDKRGFVFGAQAVTATAGNICGSIMMGSTASSDVMGYSGWRFMFCFFGLIMVVCAGLSIILLFDPVRGQTELEEVSEEEQKTKVDLDSGKATFIRWSQVEEVITGNPTWLALNISGSLHLIPWVGFTFLLLWFQYTGLSDVEASICYGIAAIGFMAGSVCGGWLGDKGSRHPSRFQHYARIMVAQGSLIIALPILCSLLLFLDDVGNFATFSFMTVLIAFLLSMSEQACDNPLLTEVVVPEVRSTAIGLAYTFMGIVSSIGSLLVGMSAEWYGYRELEPGQSVETLTEEEREHNKDALGNSLLSVSLLFWGLQICLYFLFYYLYPKQLNKIQTQLREERDRELLSRRGTEMNLLSKEDADGRA